MSELLAFREEAKFLTDLWEAMGRPLYGPIIAGGYIRDTICNKAIRDVDLYINEHYLGETWQYLFGEEDGYVDMGWEDNDTPEYQHQTVRWQLERQVKDEIIGKYPSMILEERKINLVAIADDPSVVAVTDKFNIGLSQFALDRSQQVYFSPRAYADWKGQRITVLREDWGAAATIKAVAKLQEKYGWPAFFADESQYTPEELRRRESAQEDFC